MFPTLSFPSDHGITSTVLLESVDPRIVTSAAVEDVVVSTPDDVEQLPPRQLQSDSRLRGVLSATDKVQK